jgi:hypothetical protein
MLWSRRNGLVPDSFEQDFIMVGRAYADPRCPLVRTWWLLMRVDSPSVTASISPAEIS